MTLGVRHIVAIVVVFALVVGGVIAWQVTSPSDDEGPVSEILTGIVDRQTLRDELTIRGELRRSELQVINSPFDGRVSQLHVEDGDEIEPGEVILALDGRPAVAALGDFAFYRPLDVGTDGPDVLQLERILFESGYDPGQVDNLYTEATRAALREWQIRYGYGGATPEPEETVVIALQNNTGYSVGSRNTVAVKIGPSVPEPLATDGSAASIFPAQGAATPAISVATTELSVLEGAAVSIVLTADPAPLTDTQVDLTFGGSATVDDDYDEIVTPIVWPANASSVSFPFQTLADQVLEPDEDFTLSITTPILDPIPVYTAGALNLLTVTIVDATEGGAPTITVAVDDDSINEGDGATFRVTSNVQYGDDLDIRYSVGGSAREVDDYDAIDNEPLVTLSAGSTEATFTIGTIQDENVEPDETITVTLVPNEDPNHVYTIGTPDSATATVEDADEPELTLRGGGTIGEGESAWVTIQADQAPADDISVNYQIGGSAQGGTDYGVLTGTIILRAGQTTVSIDINTIDDDVVFNPSDLIIADWPARVGTVFVDEGETVQLGQPLLNLTEPDFTIKLFASPTDRSELAVGQVVTVSIEAGDQESGGIISQLDDEATVDESGAESYEGVVEAIDDIVAVDGANVTIEVVLDERVDTLVVALAAIRQDGNGNDVVRVVDTETGGTVDVSVVTGLQEGSFVEIVTGLVGGETVVIDVTGGG